MKTNKITSIIALSVICFSLLSCDKETVLNSTQTPTEISEYVSTHFPDNKILQVVEDIDMTTKTYDVILEENINLEFNRKKEIIGIEALSKLPESVISPKINQYVASNYSDNDIIEWQLERKHQEIKLDNGLDLVFALDGSFKKIDN
ncbi:MAG: PepSY-like domain-containing protein [Bacteroidetes bacterium]|nr:PepSY-like domain-containing protein [Bacteroidota bacterium]